METSVESEHVVDEFTDFLSREEILSSPQSLQALSDKFIEFYRSLRISDALFEADGDMLIYDIGIMPEIEQKGFLDARGLPGKLSWGTEIKTGLSLRRQIYPTTEDEDVRMTDCIMVAYFPSSETERKHLLSSGWASHPDRIENLRDFLDSRIVADYLQSVPERVFAYAN